MVNLDMLLQVIFRIHDEKAILCEGFIALDSIYCNIITQKIKLFLKRRIYFV